MFRDFVEAGMGEEGAGGLTGMRRGLVGGWGSRIEDSWVVAVGRGGGKQGVTQFPELQIPVREP
jgi:hypothetical protein